MRNGSSNGLDYALPKPVHSRPVQLYCSVTVMSVCIFQPLCSGLSILLLSCHLIGELVLMYTVVFLLQLLSYHLTVSMTSVGQGMITDCSKYVSDNSFL